MNNQNAGYSKQAWINYIRNEFSVGERQPCCVCGQHYYISHAHHLIPVSEMASLLEIHGKWPHELIGLTVCVVWLCPNHHAIWHKLRNTGDADIHQIYQMLSDNERSIFQRIHEEENTAWIKFNELLAEA